jgi:hypothetical protein
MICWFEFGARKRGLAVRGCGWSHSNGWIGKFVLPSTSVPSMRWTKEQRAFVVEAHLLFYWPFKSANYAAAPCMSCNKLVCWVVELRLYIRVGRCPTCFAVTIMSDLGGFHVFFSKPLEKKMCSTDSNMPRPFPSTIFPICHLLLS